MSKDNSGAIQAGNVRAMETLVDMALRLERGSILELLCPNKVPDGAIKRMPSHRFPHEAQSISNRVSCSPSTLAALRLLCTNYTTKSSFLFCSCGASVRVLPACKDLTPSRCPCILWTLFFLPAIFCCAKARKTLIRLLTH